MEGLKQIFSVVISVVMLLFVIGCSSSAESTPQKAQPERVLKPLYPCRPELPFEKVREITEIALKAYAKASDFDIDAMEGRGVFSEFVLWRDVQGLGKKGDTIYEVRSVMLGGNRTRGIILVNLETEESLVVFPKKTSTEKNIPPN